MTASTQGHSVVQPDSAAMPPNPAGAIEGDKTATWGCARTRWGSFG